MAGQSRGLCGLVDWNNLHNVAIYGVKESRLMWPRGLKWRLEHTWESWRCRGLCGLVDWNIHQSHPPFHKESRGLCGLVDWNNWCHGAPDRGRMSRLMWPRGLKCFGRLRSCSFLCRGLCGLVDWNIISRGCISSTQQSCLLYTSDAADE